MKLYKRFLYLSCILSIFMCFNSYAQAEEYVNSKTYNAIDCNCIDNDSGLQFSIPLSWKESSQSIDNEYVKKVFVSPNINDGYIVYICDDLYKQYAKDGYEKSRSMIDYASISSDYFRDNNLGFEDMSILNIHAEKYGYSDFYEVDASIDEKNDTGVIISHPVKAVYTIKQGYLFGFLSFENSNGYDALYQIATSLNYQKLVLDEPDYFNPETIFIGIAIILGIIAITVVICGWIEKYSEKKRKQELRNNMMSIISNSMSNFASTSGFANVLFGAEMTPERAQTLITNSRMNDSDYGLSERNPICVKDEKSCHSYLKRLIGKEGLDFKWENKGWSNLKMCNGVENVTVSEYQLFFIDKDPISVYFCECGEDCYADINLFSLYTTLSDKAEIDNSQVDEKVYLPNDVAESVVFEEAESVASNKSVLEEPFLSAIEQLRVYKNLLDDELITKEDYDNVKKRLLPEIDKQM